jgi:signal transduction histidine kinase
VEALADERLLRQMITNLISNAINYSDPDQPVRFKLLCHNSAQVILRVEDHGIGISEDDQKHLFDPFHRGANVGTIAGSGLGLAITKHAVELHGGTITCDSRLGRGTTFTITLPLTHNGAG